MAIYSSGRRFWNPPAPNVWAGNALLAGASTLRGSTGNASIAWNANATLPGGSTFRGTGRMAFRAAARLAGSSVFANGQADPWASQDGRLNAPPGTPQLQTLLDGYAFPPPWFAAGVDYAVGPLISVFKNPNTDTLPANVIRDTTNKILTVNGTGVTLDGWDFTIDGGWGIEAPTNVLTSNTVIRNCKFQVGTRNRTPIFLPGKHADGSGNNSQGLTVEYCTIDGQGRDNGGGNGLIHSERSGFHWIRYCWVQRGGIDLLHIGADTIASGRDTTMLIEFNLIGNAGDNLSDFGHPDQLVTAEAESGQGKLYGDISIHFNTIYNTSGRGTQGFTLNGNTKSPANRFAGGHFQHNVSIMTTSPLGVQNYQTAVELTATVGTWDMSNNAFDPTMLNSPVATNALRIDSGFGTLHGTQTSTGNWDMRNNNPMNHPGQA